MSAQQGQTDSILKVTLPSTLLHARWPDDHVAKGGGARPAVATFHVGEGAPIKLTCKDLSGKTVGALEGKVVSNLHRTAFARNADNTTGGMTFEAGLTKHGLTAMGGAVKVWPPVDFTDPKFPDKVDVSDISRDGDARKLSVAR